MDPIFLPHRSCQGFYNAKKTADWNLHLVIVKRMLNLFAAAGRVNYAKSVRLYLQSMDALPEHLWLHQCFQEKDYRAAKRKILGWPLVGPCHRTGSDKVSQKPWWFK